MKAIYFHEASLKASVTASVKTFVEADLIQFESFGRSNFTSVKASAEANFLHESFRGS